MTKQDGIQIAGYVFSATTIATALSQLLNENLLHWSDMSEKSLVILFATGINLLAYWLIKKFNLG